MPLSLKVVAWLFILSGLASVFGMMFNVERGFSLDLNVIALFIGIGLLRLSRLWRAVALVYIGLALALAGVGVILTWNSGGAGASMKAEILGWNVGSGPMVAIAVAIGGVLYYLGML